MGSIIAQGECRGQACLPMTEPQQELLGLRPSSPPPTKQKPPAKSRGFLKNEDSRSEAGMTSKGIKREVACELAFDTRSSQAPLGE